jgi:hypothetical protein
MDLVTQQNAALVEESTAATQAMETQASQLARTIGVFRVGASQAQTVGTAIPTARAAKPVLPKVSPRPTAAKTAAPASPRAQTRPTTAAPRPARSLSTRPPKLVPTQAALTTNRATTPTAGDDWETF